MSDEEIIMGKIHGTLDDDAQGEKHKRAPPPPAFPRRPDIMTPMTPMMPRGSFGGGGAFERTYTVRYQEIFYSKTLDLGLHIVTVIEALLLC